MSEIGISYNASTDPSRLGIHFGLGFENTTLKVAVRQIDDFTVQLSPSGNVAEEIVSGIAWPLASLLGQILPNQLKSLIYGYSFDVMTISPQTVPVFAGEQVTFTPSNLTVSDHNGMLLIQASVDVS